MNLQINSKSRVPVHLQLEQQIKHLIMTGSFEVGSRLPSIRAMAGFLRINRNTVARVFSDLEREGFVESRRGSGLYVLEPPMDAVEMKDDLLDRAIDLCAGPAGALVVRARAANGRGGDEGRPARPGDRPLCGAGVAGGGPRLRAVGPVRRRGGGAGDGPVGR